MAYRGIPAVHNASPSNVSVLLTEKLRCRATCTTVAWQANKLLYIVVGDESGEIVFYATGREHVARFRCSDVPSPIRAIDVGDLRHSKKDELIAILGSGLIVFIGFPYITEGKIEPPILIFQQFLQENVLLAKILDIDGSGTTKLITLSTDKKVTVYSFDQVGLLTLRSWEVPAHITGVSFGQSQSGNVFLSLSQALQDFVVRINLSSTSSVTFLKTLISDLSHFNIPLHPLNISLHGNIVNTVLLVDDDYNSAIELKNTNGKSIVCVCSVKLSWGYQLILTVDQCGLLLVYGWHENSVPQLHPLQRIQLIVEPVHFSAVSDHEGCNLYLGIINIYSILAIYRISLCGFIDIKS